ncbi:MAG TPA: RHS repeat-associated core domain-containing protein, partial [Thermoanaerobaculia bacterium]|nr:RHS repeat-associated core domain-containing protein [Thermoanaerobaculia bacterium]
RQLEVPLVGSWPWVWVEDYVYRDGLLLGGERPAEEGGRRHFHIDHLGSPRLVTGDTTGKIAEHDYYPFGVEINPPGLRQETANGLDREEPMKFTGHERDFNVGTNSENVNYDDYMHARYDVPQWGRFLSIDPVVGDPHRPQRWNQYAYALNNPTRFADPTGMDLREWEVKPDSGRDFEFRFYMESRILAAAFFEAVARMGERMNSAFYQAKPYLIGGVELGILLIPGVGEEEGVVLTAESVDEVAATVESAELRNVIRAMFKATDEIPGGTIGAIRKELSTGEATRGVWHWRKGYERGRQLMKLISSGELSQRDMRIAKALLHELRQSLMGY